MYRVLVNGTNVYEGPEITRVLEEMCELSQVGDAIEIFQQDGTRWNLIDSEPEAVPSKQCSNSMFSLTNRQWRFRVCLVRAAQSFQRYMKLLWAPGLGARGCGLDNLNFPRILARRS